MTTAVEVAEKGHQLAAWVNFDGTLAMTVGSSYGPDAPPADYSSPNPIRAAYNVDYIIDRGTGDYEIHFENEMPDGNYSAIGMSFDLAYGAVTYIGYIASYTASSFRVLVRNNYTTTPALGDPAIVSLAVFR